MVRNASTDEPFVSVSLCCSPSLALCPGTLHMIDRDRSQVRTYLLSIPICPVPSLIASSSFHPMLLHCPSRTQTTSILRRHEKTQTTAASTMLCDWARPKPSNYDPWGACLGTRSLAFGPSFSSHSSADTALNTGLLIMALSLHTYIAHIVLLLLLHKRCPSLYCEQPRRIISTLALCSRETAPRPAPTTIVTLAPAWAGCGLDSLSRSPSISIHHIML
ncbi:hypothetical protein EDB80DRAFT_189432 [Ilyonectria destructans]|nr:hypothetical protein EDB80DRAFT_189432 [Ilyonectria destructans]